MGPTVRKGMASCSHACAQVDKVDREQGRTALSYAASYGSLDCMHVLGAAGANPFHEDAEGNTVQTLAEKSGRTGCVEAVRKLMMKVRGRSCCCPFTFCGHLVAAVWCRMSPSLCLLALSQLPVRPSGCSC